MQAFKDSGIYNDVDKNVLIRQDLINFADQSALGKVKSLAMAPINAAQKHGFDAGERANIVTAWLCQYQDAVDKKLVLNQTTLDNISAKATNYTGNMSKAGDMPYNHSALNFKMQFMQASHKIFLQDLFNRVLTKEEKLRLAVFETVIS